MEWYGMFMECAWSVPYGLHGLHIEWCINYDKVELISHLSYFNKKSCDLIYTY